MTRTIGEKLNRVPLALPVKPGEIRFGAITWGGTDETRNHPVFNVTHIHWQDDSGTRKTKAAHWLWVALVSEVDQ